MKYMKYRNAAKNIFAVVFSLCFLAAVLYSGLTIGKVIPLAFDRMCLIYIGAVVAVAILISIILAIISCGVKKREQASLQEEDSAGIVKTTTKVIIPAGAVHFNLSIESRNPLTSSAKLSASAVDIVGCETDDGERTEKQKKSKPSKKAIAVAIPLVMLSTGVLVGAKKSKKTRQLKRFLRNMK